MLLRQACRHLVVSPPPLPLVPIPRFAFIPLGDPLIALFPPLMKLFFCCAIKLIASSRRHGTRNVRFPVLRFLPPSFRSRSLTLFVYKRRIRASSLPPSFSRGRYLPSPPIIFLPFFQPNRSRFRRSFFARFLVSAVPERFHNASRASRKVVRSSKKESRAISAGN